MTHFHACVWIDYREAKIFRVGETDADETIVRDRIAPISIAKPSIAATTVALLIRRGAGSIAQSVPKKLPSANAIGNEA